MDKLPSEREDGGLQAVFQSVFPITDFRNVSQLEFVDYAIGNWECKCGHLKGLHHLRTTCKNCGSTVITDVSRSGIRIPRLAIARSATSRSRKYSSAMSR